MKRILFLSLIVVLLAALAGVNTPVYAQGAHTYTVWVGAENLKQGVSLMDYFPHTVKVHVGDTVTWKANSHEFHTVTFLANQPIPDFVVPAPGGLASPVMLNPQATFPTLPSGSNYNGQSYLNSGLIGKDPGMEASYSLTFTTPGTYPYVCIVHGMMMAGTVEVVSAGESAPTPAQTARLAKQEMKQAFRKVPSVLHQAEKQVVKPVKNPDGTSTLTVLVGYDAGDVMVMRFFPRRLEVKPGDTVIWKLSPQNTDPHTVTFLNGSLEPDLAVPTLYNGQPLLLLNPAAIFPSPNANSQPAVLNKGQFLNSGMLDPMQGPTSFSVKIGQITGKVEYLCLLHDTSGMIGWLNVEPAEHEAGDQ